MASAGEILSAFARIFADDSEFQATLKGTVPAAKTAATRAGDAFAAGFTKETAGGPGGKGGLLGQGELFGSGDPLPEFTDQFAKMRGDLATMQAGGPEGVKAIGESFDLLGASLRKGKVDTEQYALGVRDAAGTVKILGTSLLGELNPALGASANIAIDAARNLKGLGVGIAAGGAAAGIAAIAVAAWVVRIKEGIEATVQLAQAQKRGDANAVAAQAQATADALTRQSTTAGIAVQKLESLNDVGEVIVGFWDNAFGPSADKLTKRLETQTKAADALFFAYEAPKQRLQAVQEAQRIAAQALSLDVEQASSAGALADATDRLVAAKRAEAEATRDLILAEEQRIGLDVANKVITQAVAEEKVAQVRVRAGNVIREADIEERRIRDDQRRRTADNAAAEIEAVERVAAAQRGRVDAVRKAVADIAGLEQEGVRAVEGTFARRRAMQEADTQAQLQGLQAQTAAQRAAVAARLEGATGDQRASLERELTAITEEETTKRIQIEASAATQRVALAEQERQALIQRAEQVLQIQRTLGERRAQDEVRTQTAIAAASQAGSGQQIAALQKVAEAQAQIQANARAIASQALAVADQARQAAGLGASEFVSKGGLERNLERQRARDAQVRERFAAGKTVRTSELQGAVGNQGFFEQFKGFGDSIGQVFKDATTPIKAAFEEAIGPTLTAQFAALKDQATDGLAGLVTGFQDAFTSIESLVDAAMGRIVGRIQAGNSEIVTNITRAVSDNLARELVEASRRV